MMSTTNKMPTTDKNWKTVMAQGLAHGDEALAPSGKSYTCIQDSQGAKKMHNHAKNKLSGFGAPSIAVDMQSDTSEVTAMPDARVVHIGPVATTSTYVLNGIVYATLMA